MNIENKLNAQLKSNEFRSNRIFKGNVVGGKLGVEGVHETIANKDFAQFADLAYENPEGFSIRLNPNTGKKEMFIAGTRHKTQWLLNVLDTVTYQAEDHFGQPLRKMLDEEIFNGLPVYQNLVPDIKYLDIFRQESENYYANIANNNNIDVVYGHSRGGALLADMDIEAEKVGLDSAMIMAHNKDMMNFNEGGNFAEDPSGIFDYILGLGGKQNITANYGPNIHHSWD